MHKCMFTILMAMFISQAHFPPPELKGERLAFELPDLDGHIVNSNDERFRGKVILVDLWGTWCPPCRLAVPFLVELQKRYGEDGLVVVGIAFERGESAETRRAGIRKFEDEFDVNYMLLDAGGEPDTVLREALPDIRSTSAFPTMLIIGRNGNVEHSRSGFHPADKDVIEAEVKRLLAD